MNSENLPQQKILQNLFAFVEIINQAIAMMSTDKIDDTIRNIIRPSHFYPIYDMVFDDLGTLYRCEFIMGIDQMFSDFSVK